MCKWHPWHVCGARCLHAQPQAPTSGAPSTCAAHSPALSPPLARQLSVKRGGSKMPSPKLRQGFIFKANGAGGSGFPQAAKKGCIESWGGQSTGDTAAPAPAWPHGKHGQRGAKRIGTGSRAETRLGAWFWAGLWGGCWLWGQPQRDPFPPSLSCWDSLLSR